MDPAPAPDAYPLLGRRPEDILFQTVAGEVTAALFLRQAHAVAAALPAGQHAANLCQDRHLFALTMAAAVLRDQVMLLTGDRTTARIGRLQRDFPGLHAVDDRMVAAAIAAAPAANPEELNPMLPADRQAALVFTSGTTGEPIGHAKSFGALVRRAEAMRDLFPGAGTGRIGIVGTVPPEHMYGFETTITLPLHTPVTVSCAAAFYHADIAEALRSLPGPRILVTTPMQLRLLLEADADLPPLARIVSATAPMPADLATRAEQRWQTEVHEIYGATEAGSVARRRTLAGELWELFPGVILHDRPGSMEVTAPHAVPTPLNDEIAPDGRGFRLLGRKADMVKLAGKRASLAGLTRILVGIEGVRDGLFVAPDDLEDRPGARLLAYVVAPGRTSADILVDLRQLVEPAFLPRRVVCVDGLPRNALGKLPRHALARLLGADD